MYQITPEDYFRQQATLRRITPKQEAKKEEVKSTPQPQPIIIGQPETQNQNTLDKFYPLIVLAIIAIFCITLIVILDRKK